MRKSNKIMFKAVAILLSLVLLTSCVVSTTFAKYVIRKSTGPITMELEKFGVEIELKSSESNRLKKDVEKKLGDSLSVTYNYSMYPSIACDDAAKITFGGTPLVDTRITINFELDYSDENFTIYKTEFSDLATDSLLCVPVGFKLHKGDTMPSSAPYGYLIPSATSTYDTRPYRARSAAQTEEDIERKLAELIGFTYDETNGCVYKDFDADAANPTITSTTVLFGFAWTKNFDTNNALNPNKEIPRTDEIGTWIAESFADGVVPITVSYSIKAEQIV